MDNCSEEQFNYYYLAKKFAPLGQLAKWGLLLCTLFDMPSWCRGSPDACANYVKQLYSPSFPILPPIGGAGISLIFWAILALKMHFRKLAMGDHYRFKGWHVFRAVVLFL